MSIPISSFNTRKPTFFAGIGLRVALVAAHAVSRIKPSVLHWFLGKYSRIVGTVGRHAVTKLQAEQAHAGLCHISPRCASHDGCFVRSLTLYLYLLPIGSGLSWHAGFRTDPFLAHAWIQAGSEPISEALETSQFIETMRID